MEASVFFVVCYVVYVQSNGKVVSLLMNKIITPTTTCSKGLQQTEGPQFHVVRWSFYELSAGDSYNDNFLFNGIKLFKLIITTSFSKFLSSQ
jgi:hypothetical protein